MIRVVGVVTSEREARFVGMPQSAPYAKIGEETAENLEYFADSPTSRARGPLLSRSRNNAASGSSAAADFGRQTSRTAFRTHFGVA